MQYNPQPATQSNPQLGRHLAEQRYTHFFEESPTMLVITREQEGTAYIDDCNHLFQNTLGYSRTELIGHALADFYCPESKVALASEEGYRRALDTGIVDVERNLVRKDGSLIPVILRASPFTNESGKVWGTHCVYIDIHARKEAEDALQQSEERLRQALDAAQMGIWEWDIQTNAVTWSDQVGSLFGLSPGDFPNAYQVYMDLIHPEDRSLLENEIDIALTTGDYSVTHRLIRPDGSLHWLEANGRVVYDNEAQPVRMHGTVMDITERWLAEEGLRRFRFALDSSADGILLIDPVTMQLVDVNNTVCSVLGYTREEMLHISAQELLPNVNPDELIQQFKRLMDGDEAFGVMELDAYTKDGKPLPIEVYFRAHATQDGHIIVASGRNIRDRKEVEAALERERALLAERVEQRTAELALQTQELRRVTELQNAILTYGGTAILYTTPDGIIRTFNPAAEQLFAIPAADVIDRLTLVPDRDHSELALYPIGDRVTNQAMREMDISAFAAPFPGLDNEPREWAFVRQDGSKVPVLLSVTALSDEAGNPIGYAGMAHDISLHKQSEEALHRSEDTLRTANAELARALRLKDEFLANMSHELRTPLNAILNLSESLIEEIAGPLSDKQQNFCQLILESGQHLLALINDILDLSKIESGHTDIDVVPVAVEPVCQSSLRMVTEQAKKKRLTSSIHIDKRAKWVHADARQLKQMLVNLFGNAVKFTPRGGKIGIDVNVDSEAAKISFSVWDTGIGISAEDLQRLFKPFVQLDSGLSRQYGGSGLGLVLVSRMARIHGGGVRVESTPGEGSRFTIDLPWSADTSHHCTEECAGADRSQTPPYPSTIRTPANAQPADAPLILLIDDTEAIIAPVVSYLETHHYRVEIAYTGQSAIAKARELKPDLVLMDIQMPDIDGLEAARWIRSEPGLESTPIIALTALAMPGDRERCLSNGMDDYLAKPVSLRNLLEHVERYIAEGQR